MAKIITGYHFDTGTRELYEDRVRSGTITRKNGDVLDFAVVADGVGGENRGERAAQLALDAVLVYLETGLEKSIPALISKALHSANHEVFWSTRSDKGTSTTLSIAIILNSKTLFIGNVGDSRVYLVRGNKLSQLTLDHTFQNIIPIQDKMSPEAAAASPRADVLMHALGIGETVPVDIGFHVGADLTEQEYIKAQARGKKGLPLKTGDSILVCSDGLIKDSPTDGTPLIREEEVVQVLTAQEGNRAARGLVSFALGRDADDNVSVAILQTPDKNRASRAVNEQRLIRQRAALFYGGIAAATAILFGLIIFFFFRGQTTTVINEEATRVALVAAETATFAEFEEQTRIAADQTRDAQAIAVQATIDQAEFDREFEVIQTQTVEAAIAATLTAVPTATPMPTSTPRPTLAPGQIGFYRGKSQPAFEPLFEDEAVIALENTEIQINHTGVDDEDASIYAQIGGEVEFNQVDRKVEFRVFEESDILVETGLYQSGAEIEVRASDNDVTFAVSGSCMSVTYSEDQPQIVAACYEGNCEYQIDREDSISIRTGNQVTLDPTNLGADPVVQAIPAAAAIRYVDLLNDFEGGVRDIPACLQPYLPATPTPTPTPTIVIPTDTPTPEPRRNNGGGNNNPSPTQPPAPTDDAPVRPTSEPIRPTAAPASTSAP